MEMMKMMINDENDDKWWLWSEINKITLRNYNFGLYFSVCKAKICGDKDWKSKLQKYQGSGKRTSVRRHLENMNINVIPHLFVSSLKTTKVA